MNETIEKLIASGKEGSWWDFKQTYHQNNAALVHDILCMANTLHEGDRYLIFGVTDEGQTGDRVHQNPLAFVSNTELHE